MFNVVKSAYHIKNNIGHYETNFKPQTLTVEQLRHHAFTPTVFRQPTDDEYEIIFTEAYNRRKQSQKGSIEKYIASRLAHSRNGYRMAKFAIGLLDSGYVDIDGIKPLSHGLTPTIQNVHEAMNSHFHVVFQSASAMEGKLRLIYKRNFMLYLENTYNTSSDTWNLTLSSPSKKILTTNPDFPLANFSSSLPKAIKQILQLETVHISSILANAGINTSGIDTTACQAHMHSKHSILAHRDIAYETPLYNVEGSSI